MDKLSIVVPVYYNEDNLRPLYRDIKEKVLDKRTFDYEIVMVDDGSLDKSWDVMKELADQDEHIRLVHLSRNFGSHAAILCGLTASTGDCAVVKAADLQEPSELIPEMYQAWKEGSNVVLAVRNEREDKSFFSELYYWLMRKVALPSMPKHGFDVFLIDRKVIKTLELMDEKNSALTGQILWSGFKTKIVYYNRRAREIGKSKCVPVQISVVNAPVIRRHRRDMGTQCLRFQAAGPYPRAGLCHAVHLPALQLRNGHDDPGPAWKLFVEDF